MSTLTERYLEFDRASGASARYLAELARTPSLITAFRGSFLPRPVFLGADEQRQLSTDLADMYALLTSLPDRLTGGALGAFCRLLDLSDAQVDAVVRTADRPPIPLGRADLYQDEQGFKLLEFNLSSALGGLENPQFNLAALRDPAFAEFLQENPAGYVDTMAAVVDTAWPALHRTNADSDPLAVLVDVPSAFESLRERLHGTAARFTELGLRTRACATSELEERDGRLFLDGEAVDIVYRFFLIEDLLHGTAEVDHILRAAERGTVEVFMPLNSEVFGCKKALALLSDPTVQASLDAAEHDLVDRLLPWTRAMVPGGTHTADGEVDLREYLLANRDELILKATMLHGGNDVSPGWEATDAEWRALVDDAMGKPYVIQRRVRPRTEVFGADASDRRVLNWGVYLTAGGYGGAILRGTANPDVGVVSIGSGAQVGGLFHELPAGGA